jgi:5-hydroxyisourate hydrolase
MKKYPPRGLSLLLALCAFASGAVAAPRNPMSVHVLDQQTGLPAGGMHVVLAKARGQHWTAISEGTTDADGRVAALYPADQALVAGQYRVTFHTGAWYRKQGQPTFYPEVQVVIAVDGSIPHYHIPLLLSAYGYSTYRGS